MDKKSCNQCRRQLSVSEFDPIKSGKRLKHSCRSCCIEISRQSKSAAAVRRARNGRGHHAGKSYQSRAHWLNLLGFSSYSEYLASDLWRRIRSRVFAAKGRECFMCGNRADQVHHNRYTFRTLTGRNIKHLVPVCRKCHKSIEFNEHGKHNGSVVTAEKNFRKHRRAFVEHEQVTPESNWLDDEYDAIVGRAIS